MLSTLECDQPQEHRSSLLCLHLPHMVPRPTRQAIHCRRHFTIRKIPTLCTTITPSLDVSIVRTSHGRQGQTRIGSPMWPQHFQQHIHNVRRQDRRTLIITTTFYTGSHHSAAPPRQPNIPSLQPLQAGQRVNQLLQRHLVFSGDKPPLQCVHEMMVMMKDPAERINDGKDIGEGGHIKGGCIEKGSQVHRCSWPEGGMAEFDGA
mmetsp:Transcript_9860/g.28396  ORF Transcript_9860/g.28396 Transcript_9860/m.28396 type:complete len:205 (-) Transcript_9860:419-1033(-)